MINSVLRLFFWESGLGVPLRSTEKNIYLLELSISYGNIYLWKILRGDRRAHPDLIMSGVTWPWHLQELKRLFAMWQRLLAWIKPGAVLPFCGCTPRHKSHWSRDYESWEVVCTKCVQWCADSSMQMWTSCWFSAEMQFQKQTAPRVANRI